MPRVLLVDDDAAALEIRKLILERAGHLVLTASTASEARALLDAEIVVLDLRVPRVEEGLALIREFHSAGMRVIVLCGNRADLDGRPEAACVDAVIEKPARSEVLLEAVQARPKIA